MKTESSILLLIIIGILLGLLLSEWNSYQWCRREECLNNTKWLCTRTNNLEIIHWIVISILILFGIWKIKEIVY